MWVVKLGGSLQHSRHLQIWLETLTRQFAGETVIVAGGGKYADAIRQQHQQGELTEEKAHHLAICATEKFAGDMCRACPTLRLAEDIEELTDCLSANEVPVWLPSKVLGETPGIPKNWDFTSDSIAAWLALELKADALFLVKSVALGTRDPVLASLSKAGLIDCSMEKLQDIATLPIYWLEKGQAQEFSSLASHPGPYTFPRLNLT